MVSLLGYVLLFSLVGVGFIFVHLVLGKLIRPDKPIEEKMTVYECGEPTVGSAWIQFDLRYYVVALLFVIFDVEIVFFFPWAVVFRELGVAGFINMMIFIGVLFLGLIYIWKRGALEWPAAEGK